MNPPDDILHENSRESEGVPKASERRREREYILCPLPSTVFRQTLRTVLQVGFLSLSA